jgi:hypothetical protein
MSSTWTCCHGDARCKALRSRAPTFAPTGPVMTSTLAIAPSLAPVQTLLLAPVLTSPNRLRYARRPSPDGYEGRTVILDSPEQVHLLGFTRIGAHKQHAAVAQSDMRHLDGDGRAVDQHDLVRQV